MPGLGVPCSCVVGGSKAARGAQEAAFRNYRTEMDTHCKGGYLSATALSATHELAKVAALHKFDMIATIGARDDVARFRLELGDAMTEQHAEYVDNNKHRDPFKNLEFYALPLGVGIATYFLRCAAACSHARLFACLRASTAIQVTMWWSARLDSHAELLCVLAG
jgi:hypothetical protein